MIHGVGEFVAVLLREFKRAARIGIGVRGAADGGQHNRARMILLQIFLRVTGPIAADLR